jgi:hypothetical protein
VSTIEELLGEGEIALWFTFLILRYFLTVPEENGACGSVVVETLRYKPEGRGFQSDDANECFQFT